MNAFLPAEKPDCIVRFRFFRIENRLLDLTVKNSRDKIIFGPAEKNRISRNAMEKL